MVLDVISRYHEALGRRLYDMITSTPAGTQLVCEWYGVEGEQIAWIRAVFDTAPFAFLRAGA